MRVNSFCVAGVIGLSVLGAQSAAANVSDDLFIRGVTWDGRVVDIDIGTGHATQIAIGAGFRANSLTKAADGSLMFINRADDQSLRTLSADGTSIIESRMLSEPIDARALATGPGGDLSVFAFHPTEFGAGLWSVDGDDLSVSGPIRVTQSNGVPYSNFQSADYASDGTLYAWFSNGSAQAAQGLITIDPETGIGTDVSPAFDSNGANFQSIAFAPDGRLFAVTANTLTSSGVDSYSLFGIDPSTGAFEVIGAFGSDFDVRGIAVIPTPSGLSAVGIGIAFTIRRRR